MKVKSYKFLFRIFSFLSDKTNGAPLFVKYKLLLGTFIIGLASSCTNSDKGKPLIKSDFPKKAVDSSMITCYDGVFIDDSLLTDDKNTAKEIDIKEKPVTMCYAPVPFPEDENINSVSGDK